MKHAGLFSICRISFSSMTETQSVYYFIAYSVSSCVIRKIFHGQLPKRLISDKIHPNVPCSPVVHIGMLFRLYTNISMLSTKLQLTKLFYLTSLNEACLRVTSHVISVSGSRLDTCFDLFKIFCQQSFKNFG